MFRDLNFGAQTNGRLFVLLPDGAISIDAPFCFGDVNG
jgi:hypothetical protein